MVCIRQARLEDLLQMQRTNLMCLPENYTLKVSLPSKLISRHHRCWRLSPTSFSSSLNISKYTIHPFTPFVLVLLLSHLILASTSVRRRRL
jgi:hypothetical protein